MWLKHANVIMPQGHRVGYAAKKNVVYARVLVIMDTSRHVKWNELWVVQSGFFFETWLAEVIERLAKVSCVRFIMIRDIFVASLYRRDIVNQALKIQLFACQKTVMCH